jgi:hypothetical protein
MTMTLHLQQKSGSPGRSAPPATTGVPGLNRFKCRVYLLRLPQNTTFSAFSSELASIGRRTVLGLSLTTKCPGRRHLEDR